MKRHWEIDELIEYFIFLPNELSLLSNKTGATRLGFAALFKFFQHEAKFPTHKGEIPKVVLSYIAKQLNLVTSLIDEYDWHGRTIKYHRAQIREFFGFKEATTADTQKVSDWLSKHIFFYEADIENLKEEAYKKFRELQLEPPSPDRIDRITRSAIYTYENKFFQETYQKLSKESITKMENLINSLVTYDEAEFDYTSEADSISFNELRANPGRVGLESVLREITKLRTIRELELPDNLFSNVPQKIIKRYKLRAVSEKLSELRRHSEHVKYTILSAFFWLRYREITDNLIELLIQIIHRIGVRAERKVDKELLKTLSSDSGKSLSEDILKS